MICETNKQKTYQEMECEIESLLKIYKSEWKSDLWESVEIEKFGFNEFIGGKAEGLEEALDIIKKVQQRYS